MIEYKCILLADDDQEDRELIADAFAEIGMPDSIHFVEDGEAALGYLEGLSQTDLPSLIILDLNMPKLNGTQTLRALKADHRYKDITVVIYSTSINPLEKEACLLAGAHSYVTKPLLYKESLETARNFQRLCEKVV